MRGEDEGRGQEENWDLWKGVARSEDVDEVNQTSQREATTRELSSTL